MTTLESTDHVHLMSYTVSINGEFIDINELIENLVNSLKKLNIDKNTDITLAKCIKIHGEVGKLVKESKEIYSRLENITPAEKASTILTILLAALKSDKVAHHIGICNYSSALIHDLMNYCETKPEILQIEAHPYLTQEKLIRLAKNYGMEVTAFSPLGSLSYEEMGGAEKSESLLRNETIRAISQNVQASPAQVVLGWALSRGTSVVVKTSSDQRMSENLGSARLKLDQQALDAISRLNINKRYNDPGVFCEDAFNTFYPIYE